MTQPAIEFRVFHVLAMVLVALATGCSAVTLKEAQQEPGRFIYYDTSSFDIWKHALISLAITYGILVFIWGFVTVFMKITGRTRARRSYEKPQAEAS